MAATGITTTVMTEPNPGNDISREFPIDPRIPDRSANVCGPIGVFGFYIFLPFYSCNLIKPLS